MRIIGTCSICGGRVTVPEIWGGIYPPTPTCASCGAEAASHGPIIEMRPARKARWPDYTTSDGTAKKEAK